METRLHRHTIPAPFPKGSITHRFAKPGGKRIEKTKLWKSNFLLKPQLTRLPEGFASPQKRVENPYSRRQDIRILRWAPLSPTRPPLRVLRPPLRAGTLHGSTAPPEGTHSLRGLQQHCHELGFSQPCSPAAAGARPSCSSSDTRTTCAQRCSKSSNSCPSSKTI